MQEIEELRKQCDYLYWHRKLEVREVLEEYLEKHFIQGHRRWKAVIGNKDCKPIPIYRDFTPIGDYTMVRFYSYHWPETMDLDEIKIALGELGFISTKYNISLCVPQVKPNVPLTFAQKWVRKINHSYSLYIANERRKAKEYYEEIIKKLQNYPHEKIITQKDSVGFMDFELDAKKSRECIWFTRKKLEENGIYYIDGMLVIERAKAN